MIICEAILLIIGIVILITGKVKISSGKLVTGTRARVVGLIFLLPIPLGFLSGLIIGLADPVFLQRNGNLSSIFLVELIIVIGCTLLGIIIGATAPNTVENDSQVQFPPIMTPAEAARYLKVSETEVRHLIGTNKLRATLIGTEYRIARENLDALFRE